jgi:hypothetical protein
VETVNVFVTPWLSLGLIWSIIKQRAYRFPLQLFIGKYVLRHPHLLRRRSRIRVRAVRLQRSLSIRRFLPCEPALGWRLRLDRMGRILRTDKAT